MASNNRKDSVKPRMHDPTNKTHCFQEDKDSEVVYQLRSRQQNADIYEVPTKGPDLFWKRIQT